MPSCRRAARRNEGVPGDVKPEAGLAAGGKTDTRGRGHLRDNKTVVLHPYFLPFKIGSIETAIDAKGGTKLTGPVAQLPARSVITPRTHRVDSFYRLEGSQ